jgi:hypothetical protein
MFSLSAPLSAQRKRSPGAHLGEFSHPTTQFGQLAAIVECSQTIEHLERPDERVVRGRVDKVKLQKVVYPQRLEHQHHHGQVGPLDLGNGVLFQLGLVRMLGVQPET